MTGYLTIPDVSEHQGSALTDAYARPAIIFRGAFGNAYQDQKFLANASRAKALWDAGKLPGGAVVYQVPLGNLSAASQFAFLWSLIGPMPAWLTGVMLDAETWPGTSYEMHGDHSTLFNTLYGMHAAKLGGFAACKGYGNAGNLAELWPKRDARCEVIVANYSSNLAYKSVRGAIGQQYSDGSTKWPVPTIDGKALPRTSAPFGACDHNVFPGIATGDAFRKAWGRPTHAEMTKPPTPVKTSPKPPAAPAPKPIPKPAPKPTPKPPAPYYSAKVHPNAVVDSAGQYALILGTGGDVVVHHRGKYVRSL